MDQEFPSPDEIFQERYRIVSVIDRGGFGRVYRAKQVGLNRDVAIKVLQPVRRSGVDESEEERRMKVIAKRFTREAQLVSQLRDNHTVTMHDYGTTDGGLLYMVLEYIDGEPLNDLIEEHGALSPERTVKIARQILSSLEEAHALGMLHRDIKPANVMLFDHAGRTDQVKVLDFGLAKSVESGEFTADDPDLTGDEVILGTPRYMSPEQIRGEALDARTDIYSLGLVMFEMLTGFKAVEGDSTMQTLARHLNDVPIRLPETASVPGGLRETVNRMLSKPPDERFMTAREVLDTLQSWETSGAMPVLAGDSDPDDDVLFAPSDDQKRKNMMIGIGGVMALFLLIAIVSAFTGDDSEAVADTNGEELAETTDESTGDTEGTEDTEESEESVVAEVRTEDDEGETAEGAIDDPFAEAGVQEKDVVAEADDEEGDEPTEGEGVQGDETMDEEPEADGMVMTVEEVDEEPDEETDDGAVAVESKPPRENRNDDNSGNRSTNDRKSGNKKENKLKLRVLK